MGRLVELGQRRVLHPGTLISLRALAWLAVLGVVVVGSFVLSVTGMMLLGAAITGTHPHRPTDLPGLLNALTLIVPTLIAAGCYVGAVRLGENRWPRELTPGRMLPELAIGLAIGAAVMVATGLILWAAGWVTFTQKPITAFGEAIGSTVESGVIEEIMFRLVLLRLVWRVLGAWPALAVSALVFGFLHMANPNSSAFAAVCIAFEAGILLAAFYILTGRLWISIGLHAGWNFTQGWILGAAVSGTEQFRGGPLVMKPVAGVADYLSGGGFGPEASLPALLLCTAAGVAVLAKAARLGRLDGRIAAES